MNNKHQAPIKNKLDYKVINRGKCMLCGKELTKGIFFCKECEQKGGKNGYRRTHSSN